jgi:hypothetical protein
MAAPSRGCVAGVAACCDDAATVIVVMHKKNLLSTVHFTVRGDARSTGENTSLHFFDKRRQSIQWVLLEVFISENWFWLR